MTAVSAMAAARSLTGHRVTPVAWLDCPLIPRPCGAVLESLKFTTVAPRLLSDLDERQWRQALRFCDESRLTLLIAERFRSALPSWVEERLDRNLQSNASRLEGLKQEYARIATGLDAASIEHVVLKGFSHGPSFGIDWQRRPQYDLDLWCRSSQLDAARDAVLRLGFESVKAQERFPTDHLPSMIRKTGWDWKGDYFDPDMPPVVEIHFALWNERMERLAAPGLEDFWSRNKREQRAGMTIPVMREADQFAFAALHVLRHLLRGDLRALHVYEIAYFLHSRKDDMAFWSEWRSLHPPELRRLETLAAALACKWFDCDSPAIIASEIGGLPKDVRAWFENYSACPVESRFTSSKDELWLHLALLRSFRDKSAVVRRRLIPLTLPGRVESEFVPEEQRTMESRLVGAARYAGFLASRAWHHVRSWGSLLSSGIRWRRLRRGARGPHATLAASKGGT